MEDDDYLRDLMRGGGSDTSSSESDGGDPREGRGVDAGAFAALALDDDDDDGDSEDADETPRTSSSSGSSSGSSSSNSETDGDEGEAPGSDAEDAATNGWTWSTGAGPGAALTRGATAKKKKPALMPGEKRSLKKRHMAELRAARAEARNGWKPEDVKRELDTLVASGRREWTAPGGGMRTKDAKTIEALAKCYPSLQCEVETSQASGRKKRAYVTVVNTTHPAHARAGGTSGKGSETDAFVGRGRTVGGGGGMNNAEPTAAAAAARAADIAAPVPTRSEFLNDPARLARLAKFLEKGGTGPRGGDARPRVITEPGSRGTGRRVPPVSERGRRGRRDAGLTGRGEIAARMGAPVFSSAGVIDGDAGVNTAVSDESGLGVDVDVDAAKDPRNPKHPSSYSGDFGTFEAHTTGFGSRLMRRMGYVEGEGLGPDGRGLSEPVSQTSRPKNLGLGATDR